MKKVKTKIIYLIFFIFLNNNYLHAHNSVNGGCENHCNKKIKSLNIKNKSREIIDQTERGDFNSCLNTSLCRG